MKKYIFIFCIIVFPIFANAGAFDLLDGGLKAAVTDITGGIQTTAILWLSSFVLVQMTLTNIGLLKSGADIEAIFGKLIGSLLWFGFCFYILKNGPDFINNVSKGFFTTASGIAGTGGFDAAHIINNGAEIAANLVAKINKASGITNLFMPAILGGFMGVVILATAALIAFKVFLIKIEAMLIVMLSPLSFSFLGLNALKDQGIAPLKGLISLIYRMILLAVILKTMAVMSDHLVSQIDKITDDSIDGIWSVLFASVTGFSLLAFLAFKADSLASNLASGSTSLSTGDVAGAAAMGAAMGATAASGGAAMASGAASAASKAPSMASVMSQIKGGGSVSNASGSGSGAANNASTGMESPSASASLSPGNGGAEGASGGGEKEFETNSSGAPMNPDPNAVALPPEGLGGAAAAGAGNSGATASGGSAKSAGGAMTSTRGQSDASTGLKSPGDSAGIASGDSSKSQQEPTPPAMTKPQRSFLGDLAQVNHHLMHEKEKTSVSINSHTE